jgi:hypothetical protein
LRGCLESIFFGKEEPDIWWCGAAAPPYIRPIFVKKHFIMVYEKDYTGGDENICDQKTN